MKVKKKTQIDDTCLFFFVGKSVNVLVKPAWTSERSTKSRMPTGPSR